MKKILFLLSFSLLAIYSYSQSENPSVGKFHLQENGTFLTEDGTDFIVLDYPGINQEDLYNEFLVAITKLYVSPQKVIDKVENRIIRINGFSSTAFVMDYEKKLLGLPRIEKYAAMYYLQFQFKDEKMRVDAPIINKIIPINIVTGKPQDNPFSGLTADQKPILENKLGEWVQRKKLFTKEEPELTGKQKKDDEEREKTAQANEIKDKTISAINNYINGIIELIIQESMKADNGSDW